MVYLEGGESKGQKVPPFSNGPGPRRSRHLAKTGKKMTHGWIWGPDCFSFDDACVPGAVPLAIWSGG